MSFKAGKTKFILQWYLAYPLELAKLQEALLEKTRAQDSDDVWALSNGINEKRMAAQVEIGNTLAKYRRICADCGGRCCLESVERFTLFDRLVWKTAERDLDAHGTDILSLSWMIGNALKHALSRNNNQDRQVAKDTCRQLEQGGCRLGYADRPMLCASWLCPRLIQAMDEIDLRTLSGPLESVRDIHREVVRSATRSTK